MATLDRNGKELEPWQEEISRKLGSLKPWESVEPVQASTPVPANHIGPTGRCKWCGGDLSKPTGLHPDDYMCHNGPYSPNREFYYSVLVLPREWELDELMLMEEPRPSETLYVYMCISS